MQIKRGIPWSLANGSTQLQVFGVGFAILPAMGLGTPGVLGAVGNGMGVPGDYPIMVDVQGEGSSNQLLVVGPDAIFLGRPITAIQLLPGQAGSGDLTGRGFNGGITALSQNSGGTQYDLVVFANEREYIEFSQYVQTQGGYAITGDGASQAWGTANFAVGPPVGNDPITAGDNNTGSLGYDCRGKKQCRVMFGGVNANANQQCNGTGKIEIWCFNYNRHQWFKGPAALQFALTSYATLPCGQWLGDFAINVDCDRLMAVANNVANAAATQNVGVPVFLGFR